MAASLMFYHDSSLIKQVIEHEIYSKNKKHSYDRNEFDCSFVKGLGFENAVATLTFFTATIIANYINDKFDNELEIILCGGKGVIYLGVRGLFIWG